MPFSDRHHFRLLAVLGIGLIVVITMTYAQESVQVVAANTSTRHSASRSTPKPAGVVSQDSKYIIGISDVLAIDVWHEQELSRVVPVRPDGKISLPLLGEIQASGQTPLQLQDVITQRITEYLEHPQVTVIVQEANSQSFNVVGEVQKPGAYVFGGQVSVVDAIALAGGFRDFAKSKKMYVLRTMADGSQHKLPVNYNDVIKGKKPSQNIVLQSRDTVVVP